MMKKLIDIMFLAACTMMLASGGLYIHTQLRSEALLRRLATISTGQTIRVPDAIGKKTLVLELSPSCPHCKANEALYGRVGALEKIKSGQVDVLVAIQGFSLEESQAYLKRLNLKARLLVRTAEQPFPFPFRGTPTAFILSPEGKVLYAREGELHGQDEEDFIAAI